MLPSPLPPTPPYQRTDLVPTSFITPTPSPETIRGKEVKVGSTKSLESTIKPFVNASKNSGDIPYVLVSPILECLDHPADLAACCGVCQVLYEKSRKRLYKLARKDSACFLRAILWSHPRTLQQLANCCPEKMVCWWVRYSSREIEKALRWRHSRRLPHLPNTRNGHPRTSDLDPFVWPDYEGVVRTLVVRHHISPLSMLQSYWHVVQTSTHLLALGQLFYHTSRRQKQVRINGTVSLIFDGKIQGKVCGDKIAGIINASIDGILNSTYYHGGMHGIIQGRFEGNIDGLFTGLVEGDVHGDAKGMYQHLVNFMDAIW